MEHDETTQPIEVRVRLGPSDWARLVWLADHRDVTKESLMRAALDEMFVREGIKMAARRL